MFTRRFLEYFIRALIIAVAAVTLALVAVLAVEGFVTCSQRNQELLKMGDRNPSHQCKPKILSKLHFWLER